MTKIIQFQVRDAAVVDYQLFELPEIDHLLRGPQPPRLGMRQYAAVMGSGSSFGVLVAAPFVHRLAAAIDFPFLNLSIGAASPAHFLANPAYVDYANRARFCIVQVMSARGSGNGYFEAENGKGRLRPRGSALPFVACDVAFAKMIEHEPRALVRAVASDLRANWVKEMIQLLTRIEVPKILLWFAKRPPAYREAEDNYAALAGLSPQFVHQAMLDDIKPFVDDYVEVVSTRGMPHVPLDRATGDPRLGGDGKPVVETYYPSPEMHEDAFRSLLPALPRTIAKARRGP